MQFRLHNTEIVNIGFSLNVENVLSLQILSNENHIFHSFSSGVFEADGVTNIDLRNILSNFAMFSFENIRVALSNMGKVYDDFCGKFCQSDLKICDLFPFFHFYCFVIELFF